MTILRFGLALGGKSFNVPSLHGKRGGSGTAALTNTLEPSQYPTSPPQSAYKGGIPKIGGTEGGFIGLIVGLGVLILVCCGIVYYLLRTRKRDKKAHVSYSAATDTKGLFSSLPFQKTREPDGGWIRQGDEFDYDSDDMLRHGPAHDRPTIAHGERYGNGNKGYTSESRKSLRDFAMTSPVTDDYTDPFDPETLPESVRKQQAPLPASTSSTSQDTGQSLSSQTDSKLRESPTTPTFHGGTKFKEQF